MSILGSGTGAAADLAVVVVVATVWWQHIAVSRISHIAALCYISMLCPIFFTLLPCAIFPCCQVGRSLWLIVKSTAGDVDQNQFTPTLHSGALPYTFAFHASFIHFSYSTQNDCFHLK